MTVVPQSDTAPTNGHGTVAADSLSPDRGDDVSTPSVEQSDLGNARRLVAAHGKDLRHVPQHGHFLAWDGRRWKPDLTGEVMRRAKGVTDACATRPTPPEMTGRTRSPSDRSRRPVLRAMVDVASTEPGIPVVVDELDADPFLLSVGNGTLESANRPASSPSPGGSHHQDDRGRLGPRRHLPALRPVPRTDPPRSRGAGVRAAGRGVLA